MSGLSLWLSPPSPPSHLDSFLSSLSTKLDTVSFASHATLVSDAIVPAREPSELVALIGEAVKAWHDEHQGGEGLDLQFQDVRQGDQFYQCILAALVPSKALLSLHEALLLSFSLSVPSPPTYFPPLSLVYGDLSPEFKSQILADLEASGDVQPANTPEGPRVTVAGESGFSPKEILLVKTGGPPPTWEILARIPLPSKAPLDETTI